MFRLFLVVTCCFPLMILAQSPSLSELQTAIKALDRDPAMRSANWSITVMDAQTGKLLLEHNGYKSLATASTMKAVTTATALELLGPNFRFETQLQYTGRITEKGVLEGDLFIKGGGDPSLGSDRFGASNTLEQLMFTWAELIKQAGIKEIKGRVIGDAGVFGSQLTPGKWGWEDMGNYYGAGACGLTIHENQYRLDFKSSTTGSLTKVLRTVPEMKNIQFVNEVQAGKAGSGDNAYIYGSPYTWVRYLRGTVPPNRSVFSIKGSMPDPAQFCASRFTEELTQCGIPVSGRPATMRNTQNSSEISRGSRQVLHIHKGEPLSDIIFHTNMKSVNLFAESLANQIALTQSKSGSTAEGVEAIDDYWTSKGIDTKGMYLRDGSGLSPNNVLSTYQLTAILCKMRKSPHYKVFEASLPLAGRSGSLKGMLRGTSAEGRLRAKSGYISGVRSYAGYVETQTGHQLAFTMIANHFSGGAGAMRRKFETLMVKLARGR